MDLLEYVSVSIIIYAVSDGLGIVQLLEAKIWSLPYWIWNISNISESMGFHFQGIKKTMEEACEGYAWTGHLKVHPN